MTALAIIRTENGIVLASDGAGYDESDGTLQAIVTKVALMPEWSCVFGCRGTGGVTERAQALLRVAAGDGAVIEDFDDVFMLLPELCRRLYDERTREQGEPAHFSMLVGGYSLERSRWETYRIGTRPFPRSDAQHPAFEPLALPPSYFAPTPDAVGWEAVGVSESFIKTEPFDPVDVAIRAICAGRLSKDGPVDDPGRELCTVGGFLQVTTVSEDSVTSTIVHRWPDARGVPLEPRGELLPPSMQAPSLN